ncbi:MAG TPA: hypothetical protein VJC10_04250 [Patescibacteria group bacterium]|nr:hypothetical protein [Patescibacteria group bacterium]
MEKEVIKNMVLNALYWGSLLVVVVWIILKLVGVIQSPLWQELIPFAALIVPFIIQGMKDTQSIGLIKPMYDELKEMRTELKEIRKEQGSFDGRFIHVEQDIHYLRRDVDFLRSDTRSLRNARRKIVPQHDE